MNTDNPDTLATLEAYAWWYACGYNDTRAAGTPYVPPFTFGAFYRAAVTTAGTYTPSVQEAFRRFIAAELEQVTR